MNLLNGVPWNFCPEKNLVVVESFGPAKNKGKYVVHNIIYKVLGAIHKRRQNILGGGVLNFLFMLFYQNK